MLLSSLRRILISRSAITAFVLFAVGVQNYLAQTHIHRFEEGASFSASQVALAPIKQSSRENSSSCFLCQVVLHGSAPMAAALAVHFAPLAHIFFFVPASVSSALLAAVSYSWQGRGPPSF